MVHQGQGLPLGLEAGEHLAAVHAGLDDLQGHLAADGLLLLGHVDDAHAAFAELLEELVGADLRAPPACLAGHWPRWDRLARRAGSPRQRWAAEQRLDPLLEWGSSPQASWR